MLWYWLFSIIIIILLRLNCYRNNIVILRCGTHNDLCVRVRYIDFRATGNTAIRCLVTSRPVLSRYRGIGGSVTSVAGWRYACVRACARIQPCGTGMRESGHGVFRPRQTPLFHLLFIQKPTAAGLARIVSQSRVQCTLTPPHIVLVAAPPPCYQ